MIERLVVPIGKDTLNSCWEREGMAGMENTSIASVVGGKAGAGAGGAQGRELSQRRGGCGKCYRKANREKGSEGPTATSVAAEDLLKGRQGCRGRHGQGRALERKARRYVQQAWLFGNSSGMQNSLPSPPPQR